MKRIVPKNGRVNQSGSAKSRKRKPPSRTSETKRGWANVSARQACPICGKRTWCSMRGDGRAVYCRRRSDSGKSPGWAFTATKHDKNGDTFHVWMQYGDASDQSEQPPAAEEPALDLAYSTLLKGATLRDTHRQNLQARGLRDEEIDRRGYGSITTQSVQGGLNEVLQAGLEEHLAGVPGFLRSGNEWSLAAPSGIAIPVRNADGLIVALKARLDRPRGENKYVYISSTKQGGPGPGAPVHVPVHQGTCTGGEVRLTEGELKADVITALTGQLTLGLPGVAGFRKALPLLDKLRPSAVTLAFDADFRTKPNVARALVQAVRLFREQYEVAVETWSLEDAKGLDDLLVLGKSPTRLTGGEVDQLVEEIEQTIGKVESFDDRPRIFITTDEHLVNDDAIRALGRDPELYSRAGLLVEVLRNRERDKLVGIRRPPSSPSIRAVPPAGLRERMSRCVLWQKISKKDKLVPAHPPVWSVKSIHARGEWGSIRHLEAIVTGPVLRADGTILAEPGYDPTTGLLCCFSDPLPPVPAKPTREQVQQAVSDLLEVVEDFPFRGDVHRAAWVAFLLTILSRFAYEGPAPLFLVDSNVRGSGKGLLCDITSLIALGQPMSRMTNPTNNEEARKLITSIALAGDQVVLIDNVVGSLGSQSLATALTSDIWRDRHLGTNEMVEAPLNPVWCATGNNVELTHDLPRRVVPIYFSSELECPEARDDFRHPCLKSWVRQQRGRLLTAAFTILRAYCTAGLPDMGLKPWGSFDGWSRLVRGAIVWAGLLDPGEAREELADRADTERQSLDLLLAALSEYDPKTAGKTSAEILEFISGDSTRDTAVARKLREALSELCPTHGGLPQPAAIGAKFRYLIGRNVGGRCLDKRERNKTSAWLVRNLRGETGSGDRRVEPATADESHAAGVSHEPVHAVPPNRHRARRKNSNANSGGDMSRMSRMSLDATLDMEEF